MMLPATAMTAEMMPQTEAVTILPLLMRITDRMPNRPAMRPSTDARSIAATTPSLLMTSFVTAAVW